MLVLRNTFAALSVSLAILSGLATATALDFSVSNPTRGGGHSLLSKRGPIHDIEKIIQCKKKIGQDFCSTFLHLPPYAATKTVTATTVIGKTASASTVTASTAITETALAHTIVNTQTVVVAVTPTTDVTSISAIPSTSFVLDAATSTVTGAPVTVTVTSTSYTLGPRAGSLSHDPSRTRLPYWLNQYPCPLVSKACSHVVTSKTKTVTKTATAVTTQKAATTTVKITGTSLITPTTTVTNTITSTSTANAVTSTIVVTSSSVVPATSTIDFTVTPTVTATQVVTSPFVSARIRISDSNGNFAGYIRAQLDNGNSYKDTDSAADALVIAIPSNGGPQNIPVPDGEFPNLGAINQPGGGTNINLSYNSGAYVFLGQTDDVPAGQQADDGDSSYAATYDSPSVYESAVWTFNVASGALTLTWTNADGTPITPTMTTTNGYIVFVGDLSQYPYQNDGPKTLSLEYVV